MPIAEAGKDAAAEIIHNISRWGIVGHQASTEFPVNRPSALMDVVEALTKALPGYEPGSGGSGGITIEVAHGQYKVTAPIGLLVAAREQNPSHDVVARC